MTNILNSIVRLINYERGDDWYYNLLRGKGRIGRDEWVKASARGFAPVILTHSQKWSLSAYIYLVWYFASDQLPKTMRLANNSDVEIMKVVNFEYRSIYECKQTIFFCTIGEVHPSLYWNVELFAYRTYADNGHVGKSNTIQQKACNSLGDEFPQFEQIASGTTKCIHWFICCRYKAKMNAMITICNR